MAALEHFKALCCLGLPPESAMIAMTPLLHEILPHGWARMCLFEPDDTISGRRYAENPAAAAQYVALVRSFMEDPASLASLLMPSLKAAGIGWALHRQGRGYLESAYYREVEAPLDACWILDAVVSDGGPMRAGVYLTRPRSAHAFTDDDVRRFDGLRPWLAQALCQSPLGHACSNDRASSGIAGAPLRSGQLIYTPDGQLVFQTVGIEFLLRILEQESAGPARAGHMPDVLPSPIRVLLRRLTAVANGFAGAPPRMQMSSGFGILTLEAKWLVPAGAMPADVAKDPKGCLISVLIDLYEHVAAHAARTLRASGATPAQVKVGVHLALGKTKPMVASELGIQLASVADQTKKLYQRLDIHSAAELGLMLWVNQPSHRAA